MKKLLTTFLMTIVATVPFSSNILLAADSQKTYKAFDLPEEDAWIMRMEEMKKAGKGILVAEDLFRFIHSRIHESEQVIFVDVRKECDKKSEYWTDGFYVQFNQSTQKFEQSEDENECLNMLIDSLYARIDDGEYPISQFNLATLEDITDGKFVDDFELRYVRYHNATGALDYALIADQFLEYVSALSSDNTIHIYCLPFAEYNLLVDCRHYVLALCDSLKTLKEHQYPVEIFIETPMVLSDFVIIEGETDEGPLYFLLDTGSTWNLLNNSKNGDEFTFKEDDIQDVTSLKIEGREFGPISFRRIKSTFKFDAILGMEFFDYHLVFIDFENRKVHIAPYPKNNWKKPNLRTTIGPKRLYRL